MPRRRPLGSRSSISVTVDIDLCEIDDEVLEAEYMRRNPSRSAESAPDMDLVRHAHEELLRNRPNHALALIERAIHPTPFDHGNTRLMQLPQVRVEVTNV
jgi:hypothetical protein